MNHLDFRRRIATEPMSHDADLLAHRDSCPECMAVWQRAQRFEHVLGEAMAVPVPQGLAERILLAQATAERRRDGFRRRTWLAMAASAVFAVAIGGFGWNYADAHSLPAMAVAHMPYEMNSLAMTTPVAGQDIEAGFAGRGVRLRGPMPADVTYVHECMVGGEAAVHLVTRAGTDKPVVALYIPGRKGDNRSDFSRGGWKGRDVPMAGGTLVLLSRDASMDALDRAEGSWQRAIDGVGGNRVVSL